MAYTDLAGVKARAGVLSPAWGAATLPSNTDVTGFITETAAQIDAAIAALGFTTPVAAPAATALKSLNEAGTLVKAIPATFPSGEGPAAADALLEAVTKEWEQFWSGPEKSAAVVLLTSTVSSGEQGASSFWTSEPDYPTAGDVNEMLNNPQVAAPLFARGQKL
jgi:hypothetical protein